MAECQKNIAGFELVYSLVTFYDDAGLAGKWILSDYADSDTITIEGQHWRCDYFTIGEDVTRGSAVKEFYRDGSAFDVFLYASVSKCGVELFSDYVISTDYSYRDGDEGDLFNDLLNAYSDDDEYIAQAKNKLMELIA